MSVQLTGVSRPKLRTGRAKAAEGTRTLDPELGKLVVGGLVLRQGCHACGFLGRACSAHRPGETATAPAAACHACGVIRRACGAHRGAA